MALPIVNCQYLPAGPMCMITYPNVKYTVTGKGERCRGTYNSEIVFVEERGQTKTVYEITAGDDSKKVIKNGEKIYEKTNREWILRSSSNEIENEVLDKIKPLDNKDITWNTPLDLLFMSIDYVIRNECYAN